MSSTTSLPAVITEDENNAKEMHLPMVLSADNKWCYYTWCADGTVFLNEMFVNAAKLPLDDIKQHVAQSASYASDIGCQTDSQTEDGVQLDEYTALPKHYLYAKDGNIVKKSSISHLVNAIDGTSNSCSTIPRVRKLSKSPLPESRVLVLYTGGTVGMRCKESGVYEPEAHYLPLAIRDIPPLNDKAYVEEYYGHIQVKPYCLPPVRNTRKRVVYWLVEYEPLLDSSDMTFDDWIRIAKDIWKSYHNYDGFVILHGTDTLAYTASALSFMMENLGKPVVITGAQIPVAEVRSDGRENLIGALIVASNYDIPEVTVYFNNQLMRGNRCIKMDNSGLEAFDTPNMNHLATMEITIKVNYESIFRPSDLSHFRVQDNLCRNVSILRIFPSMTVEFVRAALQPPIQGVVIQSYGSGNMPSRRLDIIQELDDAIKRGVIVVNVTQCIKGHVDKNYLTGKILYDIGVIAGSDMTTEAALIKLSYVLGHEDWDLETKKKMMAKNLRGELTMSNASTTHAHDIVTDMAKNIGLSTTREINLLREAVYPPLLCHYARHNDIEQLEKLRLGGAHLSGVDSDNTTPLHVACESGNKEAALYLLKHGASVHSRDARHETPLIKAVSSKNLEIVTLLRDAGATVNEYSTEIRVAIYVAAAKGDIEALQAWKAAGCTLAVSLDNGQTPLHAAVAASDMEAIRYLLECGLDPRQQNDSGASPLDDARAANKPAVVDLLEEYAAKISTGPTPHHHRHRHGANPRIRRPTFSIEDPEKNSSDETPPEK